MLTKLYTNTSLSLATWFEEFQTATSDDKITLGLLKESFNVDMRTNWPLGSVALSRACFLST